MYDFILPALIASVGWGISPFFDKIVVKNTDAETALTFKGLLYGLIGLIIFAVNSKHFLKIKDKYYILKQYNNKKIPLIVFSVISVFFSFIIGNSSYLIAMNSNSGPTMFVPLIAYVMPLIFMTFISYFVTKEKINSRMLLGIVITIFGISFTLYNQTQN